MDGEGGNGDNRHSPPHPQLLKARSLDLQAAGSPGQAGGSNAASSPTANRVMNTLDLHATVLQAWRQRHGVGSLSPAGIKRVSSSSLERTPSDARSLRPSPKHNEMEAEMMWRSFARRSSSGISLRTPAGTPVGGNPNGPLSRPLSGPVSNSGPLGEAGVLPTVLKLDSPRISISSPRATTDDLTRTSSASSSHTSYTAPSQHGSDHRDSTMSAQTFPDLFSRTASDWAPSRSAQPASPGAMFVRASSSEERRQASAKWGVTIGGQTYPVVGGRPRVMRQRSLSLSGYQARQNWASSLGLERLLADCLTDNKLGTNSGEVLNEITRLQGDEIDDIIARLAPMIRSKLIDAVALLREMQHHQRDASPITDNSKFLVDSQEAGTASFGTLSDFFSGLDWYLGLPHPRSLEAMMDEHLHESDSETEFVTSNYGGIKTCPKTEWEYVFNPEMDKSKKLYPGSKYRTPEPLSTFLSKDEAVKADLADTEVAALRLFTGPMYMKYNAVLREIGKLKSASKEEQKAYKSSVNRYVTTIHAIVSGVIKLMRTGTLTKTRKVYRGLSGKKLPPALWEPDENGCTGVVEYGLMSTTTNRDVATHYSLSKDGSRATIFEIEVGQVDRGASLQWCSQHPSEEEILMPPLSNLEITGSARMELTNRGTVMVVPMRVNVNIKSLTMDELAARRKILHVSMMQTLLEETRRYVQAHSVPDEPRMPQEEMFAEFVENITVREEQDPSWFNIDANYRLAINDALDLKSGIEEKWRLLHNDEHNSAHTDFYERVVSAPSIRFCDEGFMYVLRSGLTDVPWGAMISGGLKLVKLPYMTEAQAVVAWECVVRCQGSVRTVQFVNYDSVPTDIRTAALLEDAALDLRELHLGPSVAQSIAPALELNQNLTSLNVGVNRLRNAGATALGRALRNCTQLKSLNLFDNWITAEGAAALSGSLQHTSSLTNLVLTLNPLRDEGVEAIGGLLRANTQLTCLEMFYIPFGTKGVCALSAALANTTTLRSLELSPGAFLEEEISETEALAEVIRRNVNLTSINVTGMKSDIGMAHISNALKQHNLVVFGGGFTVRSMAGAEHMAKVMQNNESLRVFVLGWDLVSRAVCVALEDTGCRHLTMLILQGCRFEAGALGVLARALDRCTCLTDLRISSADDGGEGMERFLQPGVAIPSSVRKLCMGCNRINDVGTVRLCEGMRSCTSLTVLTLHRNDIGPVGATAIAGVLRHNTKLAELDLAYNRIGREGAASLCKTLIECPEMNTISLAGNGLSTHGALELEPILRLSTSLTSLNLHCNNIWSGKTGGNDVHDEGWQLVSLLQCCESLKSVDLTYNGIQTFVSENVRRFITAVFAAEHPNKIITIKDQNTKV